MPTPYNVVALISGGKDSFFSLLHCLANGHTLVALANLHPPLDAESEELDSYMYQTVGHRVVPLYEAALGVPLYRGVIQGGTGSGGREYMPGHESDETEDLIPLLRKVMQDHPHVNAVSTGAILSTYQRTRVENVAARLGLASLAFLWMYPFLPPYEQAGLLGDMARVGQDSRIVKVASAGLAEDVFLWRNVADPATVARMKRALGRFGGNGDGAVLGEGGEYETVTLDGPEAVWRGRVVVEGEGGYVVDGAGEGRVVMKGGEERGKGLEGLRIPSVWDEEFEVVLGGAVVEEGEIDDDGDEDVSMFSLPDESTFAHLPTNVSSITNDKTVFTFTNITAAPPSPYPSSTPQSQLSAIFERLETALSRHNLVKTQITQCTLLLRSMSDFAAANTTYASYFDFTNPPARITVAVGALMPKGSSVMLSILAHRLDEGGGREKREGLHVQSQSYWAPANIGPYSQAISVPLFHPNALPTTTTTTTSSNTNTLEPAEQELQPDAPPPNEVHIAGQIPLVPSSMQLLSASSLVSSSASSSFTANVLLSLQHLWRIGRCMRVTWWTSGVAMIPYSADRKTQRWRVREVQRIWKVVHGPSFYRRGDEEEERDEVDLWDQRNFGPVFEEKTSRAEIPLRGVAAISSSSSSSSTSASSSPRDPGTASETVKTTERVTIEETTKNHGPTKTHIHPIHVPPCYVIEVSSLPRNAELEWCCGGVTVAWKEGITISRLLSSPPSSTAVQREEKGTETFISPRFQSRTTTTPAKVVRDKEGGGGRGVCYFTREIPFPPSSSSPSFSSSNANVTTAGRHYDEAGGIQPNPPYTYATLYTSSPLSPPSSSTSSPIGAGRVQWVPCFRVWGERGREVGGVLVGRREGG